MNKFKLHHIAYAVKSTDQAIEAFKSFYPEVVVYKKLEPSQNVLVTFLKKEDEDHVIELVEAAGNPSPIDNMVNDKNISIYHLGYIVDNFETGVESLKEAGFMMISKPFQAQLVNNLWASHFFHPNAGVIEIMGEENE